MNLVEMFNAALFFIRSNMVLLLIVLTPLLLLAWFRPRLLIKGAAVGAVILALVFVLNTFMDVTMTGVAQKERMIEKSEAHDG
ncbi:MAG: hypothetical protein ACLFQR_13165 [Desulfovibrionales bacterium]